MTKTTWRGLLNHLARNIGARRAGRVSDRSAHRRSSRRLELERLEDRIAPATNITVIVGAAGSGSLDSFLSATQGTITTADDPGDPAATLSTGALVGVNSTTNISIAADNAITFTDLGGTLTLQTGVGHSAAFSTTTGPITFANVTNTLATSVGALGFTAGTSFTAASLVTNAGLVTNGADITLIADTMVITQPIDAGISIVTLAPFTSGRGIDAGLGVTVGDLDLSNAALGEITAGTLRIGSSGAGALTVTAALNDPAGATILDLQSGAAISQNISAAITVTELAAQGGGGVSLGETNAVSTLAGSAGTSFTFTNTGDLTISAVAGVNGVSTADGAVNLTVNGGNLTTNDLTASGISAPANTVTLDVSGTVARNSLPPGIEVAERIFFDVSAAGLAVASASAVGTSGRPLNTAVGAFAAHVGDGGVFLSNTSAALDIGTVSGVNGVSATGGAISISTSADLTVSQPVSTTGAVTLTGGAAGAGTTIDLNAGINGSSVTVQGGAGDDVFNVTPGIGALSLLGLGGNDIFNVRIFPVGGVININGGTGTTNTLNYDAANEVSVGTLPGALQPVFATPVEYTSVQVININNAQAVDAFYGPETADRATALAGLTADERFVQMLYLDALGRAGSKSEIDAWAATFNLPNTTHAQAQREIATGIEGSFEGRDHLVKSWYLQYLGRPALGGEELGWVNGLMHGLTEEQILSDILGDSGHEFYNRAQTLSPYGTGDEIYVRALYNFLLHRGPSTAEMAGWVNSIPTLGIQGVAQAFLNSLEFRTYEFEGYYNALLHRPDDSAGLMGWATVTNAPGTDVFSTRIDFESGLEFFNNG